MEARPEPEDRRNPKQPGPWRLVWTSVLLGLLALGSSLVVGLVSYQTSRKAVLDSLAASRLRQARTLAIYTDKLGESVSEKENLAELVRLHETGEKRFEGSYVCFIRPDGVVAVDSREHGRVGENVGEVRLDPPGPRGEETLGALAAQGGDWVGVTQEAEGEVHSAFANSLRPLGLLGIRVPLVEVEAEVRSLALPWAMGLGGLTTVLFLVAFMVLHRAQTRSEVALRESKERYRSLVDLSPDGVFVQVGGKFVFANGTVARLVGAASREALIGREVMDFIHPESQRIVEDRIRRLREEGRPAPFIEEKWIRLDGSVAEVEVGASPFDYQGRRGAQVVVRDISERKRLEEQFRQAQKMESVGRLAGGIAHDFNNLLMVIAGHGELLQDKLPPEDPCRRHADEIRQTAERASALTRQLLAFSRRQVLLPRVLNLNSVVAEMESLLRRLIGEDIELVTRLGPAVGHVKADPSQLEQVVMNLVVNARDAMPRGGKLTLVTENVELDEAYARGHVAVRPGQYVMLAISDTGQGMDKGTLAQIFEPFFTTKEKGKGTGLGLATVYGIVKQSGGNVWVYSEPGRGTTFKIYLPRAGEKEEPAVLPAPTGAARLRDRLTVLLVEDEPALRQLVRGFLESSGHRVLEASSAEEALQTAAASTEPIQLLMTDVVMPGMTGRSLAEQLATRYPELKVLFMSGYTEDAIVHHGVLEAGIAFLQKPFTLDTLSRKLREVMAG